ncbi:MAG: 3-isopropylmalate dehydrogenase [Cellulomonadaceae bacterium]|jgi:3-isopropylmalate dehydrogenase|nr:3-isopropylmalate dehydrogenase [Cellulomonadaceae bacterium]
MAVKTHEPGIIDLAVIPGDGIGTEVVEQALVVLQKALSGGTNVVIKPTYYDLGADRYHRTGEVLTDAELEAISGHDAILLGAVGDPSVPSGILERGLLLKLRFALDLYANLRPVKLYEGVESPLKNPGEIDFVVVREGTEGPYAGHGGNLRKDTPHEIATEVSINTAYDVERLVRYAFELASKRPKKHLSLVHKNNVLVHAGDLYERVFSRVAKEYPEVRTDYYHTDATTIFLTTDPQRFDVIVTDNLFGDIITDQAAAISGGMGLAASGCINPEGDFPSMFEPIHGSAPDIAGKGIADPTATILSTALMLEHLGFEAEAAKISAAVEADLAERGKEKRSTAQVGSDIAARL